MTNKNYDWYPSEHVKDLGQLINNASLKYGTHCAFSWTDEHDRLIEKSFVQLRDDIHAMGNTLSSLGLLGSHIALLGSNSYQWLVVFLAVSNGNGVIVPVDKELTDVDVHHILSDSGCKGFFFDSKHQKMAQELIPTLPHLQYSVCLGTQEFSILLEQGHHELATGHDTLAQVRIDTEKMSFLMYTSGTTGYSKGVMLCHKGIAASIWGCCAAINMPGAAILVLPFHHTLGFISAFMLIHSGQRAHLNQDLWNLANEMALVKPKIMSLVPLFLETIHKKIWDTAAQKGKARSLRLLLSLSNSLRKVGIDLRKPLFKSVRAVFGGNIKVIFCGGAPMNIAYERFVRDIGINFLWGYGITECSPGVSTNREAWYREKSVGHPFPGVEARIHNPDENGEGEILIRGDNVMLGYYKNPEASAAVLVDGWFHSGDIGRIDADGFLYLTGRSKNIIILSNGKNVYPEEIELEIVSRMAGIAEVVVRQSGKKILAEIFPNKDYLHDEGILDVMAFFKNQLPLVNAHLANHKQVHGIQLRDTEFEKTTTKKIRRHAVSI